MLWTHPALVVCGSWAFGRLSYERLGYYRLLVHIFPIYYTFRPPDGNTSKKESKISSKHLRCWPETKTIASSSSALYFSFYFSNKDFPYLTFAENDYFYLFQRLNCIRGTGSVTDKMPSRCDNSLFKWYSTLKQFPFGFNIPSRQESSGDYHPISRSSADFDSWHGYDRAADISSKSSGTSFNDLGWKFPGWRYNWNGFHLIFD